MKNDKQLAVLITNHNYFVRTVITEVVKLILTGILIWIALMIGAVYVELSSETSTLYSTGTDTVAMFCAFIMIVLVVGYIAFLIVSVTKILKLHKTVTKVENKVLGDEATSVKD